jgi:antitoxin PrlF
MTKRAKITSKGQVTVPHAIRRALGVRPGDHLLFEQKGSEVRVTAVKVQSPFEQFRGIGTPGISAGRKGVIRWVRKIRGR